MTDDDHPGASGATPRPPPDTKTSSHATDDDGCEARSHDDHEDLHGPHACQDGCDVEIDRALLCKNQSLVRQLEHAREQHGSPSLWDAVAVRLDAEDVRRDIVAPMVRLLDQIRDRVDDETRRLLVDFEWRCASETMAGVEIGLELGYQNGRATVLMASERALDGAAENLRGRLTDLLGDTEAEHSEVLIALLDTLRAAVVMARGERSGGSSALMPQC